MQISEFRKKWRFFTLKGRAQKIAPSYFPDKASASAERFAAKFPAETSEPVPTADADATSITRQAFEFWLSSNTLPPAREDDFAEMTGLALSVWASDLETFEAAVRREAKEWLNWAGLVREAVTGAMTVEVEDTDPVSRFTLKGVSPDHPRATPAWVGCDAWVTLPPIAAVGESDWRAWLIADYAPEIFVLDPAGQPDGTPTPTKLSSRTRTLPRGWRMGISDHFDPDRTFDTVVLAFNLEDQAAPVADALIQLERRLVVSVEEVFDAAAYRRIRLALDEAASLLDRHAVTRLLYSQPCVIVRKPRP